MPNIFVDISQDSLENSNNSSDGSDDEDFLTIVNKTALMSRPSTSRSLLIRLATARILSTRTKKEEKSSEN